MQRLYAEQEQTFTAPVLRHLEKVIMLQTIDTLWKDHLLAMDHLKEGIGLRGYAQVNPLQEYQREGFEMFEAMMGRIEPTSSRSSTPCSSRARRTSSASSRSAVRCR